jgi:hypothetical protein
MTPREQSIHAVELIKQSILAYLSVHPVGATNAEIAEELNLRSDFEGKSKDYLSYSLLGLLIREGKVYHEKIGNKRLYYSTRTKTMS